MIKTTLIAGMFFLLFGVGNAWAQPALDTKTQTHQTDQQTVQIVSPTLSQNTVRTQPSTVNPIVNQSQKTQDQTAGLQNRLSEDLQNLQNKVKTLENQIGKTNENTKTDDWLIRWWQIGFWVGILWFFLWIFVGWQWAHFKFWDFGWPWPWWFWIPILWFIPWLFIAWQWWLIWWVWWMWVWWIFPWVFWLFWWIILFKESTIWVWHRRKPSSISIE